MDTVNIEPTKSYNYNISNKKELSKVQNKYNNELCNNKMTFQECELTILRQAVDVTEKVTKKKMANSDEINEMLKIVESFLKKKKLICYGGTAINNILPKEAQFYDKEIEIPDYDFYSPNALKHAVELADNYYKSGYVDVEAKAGVHKGTFKVFVNFIPIADITQIDSSIFETLLEDTIVVHGINYSPPDFLRMNMYLELSRPRGDVSRWEKVLKRLVLLNKYYPMNPGRPCNVIEFQRKLPALNNDKKTNDNIFDIIWDSLVKQDVVFFGGYAASLFSKYMNDDLSITTKVPDFDILCENPEVTSSILKDALKKNNFTDVDIVVHKGIDELISEHVEFKIFGVPVLFIYKPVACHSYNKIKIHGKRINIATIDTILTLYLALMYARTQHYTKDRLLCMAKYLFDVEARNRLSNKGLLKRFSISCFGKQKTLTDIRQNKAEHYKLLRNKRNTKEYNEWFLKYDPGDVLKKSRKTLKKRTPRQSKTKKERVMKSDENYLY